MTIHLRAISSGFNCQCHMPKSKQNINFSLRPNAYDSRNSSAFGKRISPISSMSSHPNSTRPDCNLGKFKFNISKFIVPDKHFPFKSYSQGPPGLPKALGYFNRRCRQSFMIALCDTDVATKHPTWKSSSTWLARDSDNK